MMPHRFQDIGVFGQLQLRGTLGPLLLDLPVGSVLHPIVGDGGNEDACIAWKQPLDRFQHLARGFHMGHLYPCRVWNGDRTGNQMDIRPELGQRRRDGMALFAR